MCAPAKVGVLHADGELLTCALAGVFPMAQRYFM